MTVTEFANNLRRGIEECLSRGLGDDSKIVARFHAPNDEFMGPRFRPKLMDEQTDVLAAEHLYGVTMFQARLALSMLGVPQPPKDVGSWG